MAVLRKEIRIDTLHLVDGHRRHANAVCDHQLRQLGAVNRSCRTAAGCGGAAWGVEL